MGDILIVLHHVPSTVIKKNPQTLAWLASTEVKRVFFVPAEPFG